ncbi:MAG: sigma-70 family RNA polymerase sigma factor [Planctomycetia bacterium]
MAADREQSLIAECLSGKLDSFGDLIAPYQDRLYNTLFRLTGCREEAAELLQEALIRAYRGLRSYQGDSAFYTWIYRIALNAAFTRKRRAKLRTVSAEAADGSARLDLPDPSADSRPSRGMELDEQRRLVQEALAEVPEPFRTVLVLKDVEGMKYEDIAEVLDVPIGTVRSRLHRARGELRHRLKPLFDDGLL